MLYNQPHGLLKKHVLSGNELVAIKQLAQTCENYENLHMRIFWSMLQDRPGTEVLDFLYYEYGELVGYLGLDSWGLEDKELIGMVLPTYRRKGIFRQLLAAAQEESQPLGIERLILICEASASSGQAFIKASAATYSFSEHEMLLTHFQPTGAFDERLLFRPATSDDTNSMVTILANSFNDSEDKIRRKITTLLHDLKCKYYIATLGDAAVGCSEPVGCLRVDDNLDGTFSIYSFAVDPAYQRRGYGRQILEEVIRTVHAQGHQIITLDVDSTNARAINLYRSSGFQTRATYDYYTLTFQPVVS